MPLTTVANPRTDIDPARVGAALGITTDTGTDYSITDAYGVTYTGVAAHVALSALARPDLTGDVYPDQPAVARNLRIIADTLIDWVTSPHADPQHAAEFAALPAMRVCELVVYLCRHGDPGTLNKVGPEALRYYTDHLLHDPWPSAEHPLPQLIDQPYRSLAGSETHPRVPLQVTATAPGGADEVAVPMVIDASEDIHWRVTVAIPVPVDELNELLWDPDYLTGDYLADNRELIDRHLVYRDSRTEQGIQFSGRLASPQATPCEAPAETVLVDLFFVGPDRDTALSTQPFGSRDLAEQATAAGDRIFISRIAINADTDTVLALT